MHILDLSHVTLACWVLVVVFPSCSSDRGCISSNWLTSSVRLVRSVSGLFLFVSLFLMQLFYVASLLTRRFLCIPLLLLLRLLGIQVQVSVRFIFICEPVFNATVLC